MESRLYFVAAALLTFAQISHAHTHLTHAMPADNSVLAAPPSAVLLHFSEPTRLTALTLQKDGVQDKMVLGPLPDAPTAEFNVPVTSLAPGKYTLSWRAVGNDSHVMSGTLHFTISSR